ncbi:terminase [Streptomyces sp. NPDC046925]|uniref:terminase n=1 Tax=Streptomyces sp. NPDC046925 TaxID=3155375 RepID=UPI0033F3BE17
MSGAVIPGRGDQRPRILAAPPRVSSAGADVAELAAIAGLPMDPWQRLVLEEALGQRADGSWSAFEVGLVVGRQNGKGAVLEAIELASLYLLDEELCIHSAHLFDTSLEAFKRILGLIENTPDLDRMVRRVSRSHGEEGIEVFRDGALRRLRFRSRTAGGGRGFTCDRLVLDEAMILTDRAVGSILPTLSAVPDPQVWYTGSSGNKDSTALGRVRARGIAGSDPRLCYLEWSIDACTAFCPVDCEDHDRQDFQADPRWTQEEHDRQLSRLYASYPRANPGFGIRIGGTRSPERSVEHIEAERRSMSAEEFARERLGVGDWPVEGESWRVIDEASWKACVDAGSMPDGELSFGIELTPDRKAGCITVAGFNADGLTHVEITSDGERLLDHRPGDRWIVARVKELAARWRPRAVVINRASQAGALIPALEKAGITVISPTAREFAQACGSFASAVVPMRGNSPTLVHLDQVPLTAAVAGADKRTVADLWAWDQRGAAVDISPLQAATLAMWGLQQKPARKPVEAGCAWG